MRKICIVGIGWIGLSSAVILANRGFNVVGIDINDDLIHKVNRGESPFYEPALLGLLAKAVAESSFRATSDYNEISSCNTVVITTSMSPEGREEYIQMITTIGDKLRPGQLVIIRTTLPPDMANEICDTLEKASGLSVEKDLFLAFVPERFVEGNAVAEIMSLPQLVGACGEGSFKRAKEILKRINEDIVKLEPETALFAKLINNIYRNTMFALANEIALIGEIYGIDSVLAIKYANYNYQRSNVPTPGLVGGSCLTKDPYLMLPSKTDFPDLVLIAKELNDYIPYHIFRTILGITKPKKVCILGLTFKKDVADTRLSQSKVLVDLFTKEGIDVSVHDPFVTSISAEEALAGADVVILATNHFDYKRLPELIVSQCIFYDCWGMFEPGDFKEGITYMGLGRK